MSTWIVQRQQNGAEASSIQSKKERPMTDVSLPPVPQKLRETLKDYPEHIERLQAALNSAAENPSKATLPFEFAIWMLKGTLGEFVDEARDEVQAAQAR
ncbi:hypothetical protein AB4084_13065, partial [Lysobacter sp. 2RAB21]